MVPRHPLRRPTSTRIAWPGVVSLVVIGAPGCLPDLDPSLLEADSGVTSACHEGAPDGVLQAGEECDDTNLIEGDGCTADCRLACEGALDPQTGACYFAVGPDALAAEATGLCTEHGASVHVVSIHSDRERQLVQGVVEAAGYDHAFAGLFVLSAADLTRWWSAGPKEPGWSADCPGCYSYWGAGEPDTSLLRRVAVMRASRQWAWAAEAGDSRYGVVCERPLPGRPPDLCEEPACSLAYEFAANGHTYRVREAATGVLAADQDCKAWKGTLAVWDSVEEREMLVRLGPTTRFWIGLVRKPGDVWQWVDGVPASQRAIPWSSAAVPDNALVAVMGPTSGFDTSLVQAVVGAGDLPYICRK